MNSVSIVITSAPYGREDTFIGLYIPFTTISQRIRTYVLLIEDGVYSALRNQNSEVLDYPDVLELVKNIIVLGGQVYADAKSCSARGIRKEELVEGVELAREHELASIVTETEGSVFF